MLLNRKRMIALTSLTMLSTGASPAHASATAGPPPSGPPLTPAQVDRLLQLLREEMMTGKSLALDLQKIFGEYASRVARSATPAPPPTPDPKIYLDLQKLVAKHDAYFDLLRQITDKYHETCQKAIKNIH